MKKAILLTILGVLLTTQSRASEVICDVLEQGQFDSLEKFVGQSNQITGTFFTKVLDITVTKYAVNQGNGNVSILTDEKGNLSAIKVEFTLNGKITDTMIKTFDELQSGQGLNYVEDDANKTSGLIVKKSIGSTLSASLGGPFDFSILTAMPSTYTKFSLNLNKIGGKWNVKNQAAKTLKSVDLTPNVDWSLNWDGTFSEATFM